MIAIALSCQPELLIADEPTTALDVTIQAQIIDELKRLRKETGTAIMLITHDLGVVADMAEKVLVMYAGKVAEHGATGYFPGAAAPLHRRAPALHSPPGQDGGYAACNRGHGPQPGGYAPRLSLLSAL